MEDDPAALPTTPAARAGPRQYAALVGQTLAGRYRVTAVLGAGGMGAVLAAIDQRLGREVAVKLVRSGHARDATTAARFVREARAVGALKHPAVVTIYDAAWDTDEPYIVMERLVGESLAERLRRGPLAPAEAVRIMARVLEGLGAAHAAGVVHRDVKPANLFLCAPDAAPRVLDFGVAAVADAAAIDGENAQLTATGEGIGTPLYMAPEQLHGAPATARADIYAAGAVLYEMLSGRAIYEAASVAALCAVKLTERPRPLAALDPTLPRDLVAAVERALESDPARRFASADEMRAALCDAVEEPATEPRAPRPATAREDPRPVTPPPAAAVVRPRRRPPAALLALGAVVSALATAAVARVAVRAWQNAHERRPTVATPVAVACDGRTAPCVGLEALRQFRDASGSARYGLDNAEFWADAAADFARFAARPGAPLRYRSANALADAMARERGHDVAGALAAADRAVALEPDWALAHMVRALVRLRAARDVPGSIEAARQAALLEPRWWFPVAHQGYAHLRDFRDPRRGETAVALYERALRLAPDEAYALDGMVLALHVAGLETQAEATAARAIARDPNILWSRALRAEAALARGDAGLALAEAERAVRLSPRSIHAQIARANALLALGRRDEARAAYVRALAGHRGGVETALGRTIQALHETVLVRGELPAGPVLLMALDRGGDQPAAPPPAGDDASARTSARGSSR